MHVPMRSGETHNSDNSWTSTGRAIVRVGTWNLSGVPPKRDRSLPCLTLTLTLKG